MTARSRRGQPGSVGLIAVALLACAALLAACADDDPTPSPVPRVTPAPGAGATCVAGSVTASGSTALQPLVDAAAKAYEAACPGSTINVQGGGSGSGLTQVLQGAVDIGNSDIDATSRLVPAEASQLTDHVICLQAWVMVLNKKVTGVTNLSLLQAKKIWTGAITNWKDVGGPDASIVLILRPASSGTRAVWKQLILQGELEATGQALTEDSNGAVTTAVVGTDYSTSIIGLPYYMSQKDALLAVSLQGVEGSVENLVNKKYIVQGLGHMYTKGQASGLAQAFLDFMASDQIQNQLIPSMFYAPVPKG